jgi:hypothetical protein
MSRDTKTSKQETLTTPTGRVRRTPRTGSSASTKPTSKTKLNLEEEAKKFTAKKRNPTPPKPLTSRIYLAGQAMSALISRNNGVVRRDEIKREAFEWADFMLED